MGSGGQGCAHPSLVGSSGLEEPGRQEVTSQAQSLSFKNPDPEFWRIVKDSSLTTNNLGKKKCLGKRPRKPDANSGCIKQRLFLGFLSKTELGASV